MRAIALLLITACAGSAPPPAQAPLAPAPSELAALPAPQTVELTGRSLALPETLSCAVADPRLQPLISVLDYEYRMLTGGRIVGAGTTAALCRLALDTLLAEEEYRLEVDETVRGTGGSYAAVAMGTVTLMQMLRTGAGGAVLPTGTIQDRPDKPYRGLLIDLARKWHDVAVIEQVILLARWYKINHLQLHLTDDQLFTFPTESFPRLPTPGRHYTREQLRRLDEFARDRGVTLVPELEVPGHAGQFVSRMPELFAIRGWERNRGTLNMGREQVYEALDQIIGEIAEVFETSPYLHIGADEAGFQHHENDPDVQRYLATHGLRDVNELYRHFLVRMHKIVKRHGKRTIVWEGFHREGEVEIPRDVLVMAWETLYQLPQDLLADGYTIINVSWQPLYVVNDRRWDPEYIYGWNLYRWENWLPRAPAYTPIQLAPSEQVIGASMASWDQAQHLEIWTLRRRLPAMSERIWSATLEPERPVGWFLQTLERTDSALQRILSPVAVQAEGLLHPEVEDGRYQEQFWFDDRLVVTLSAPPGMTVRYTTDGTEPTTAARQYAAPITLTESTSFQARAFRLDGEPAGYARWFEYRLRPIHVAYEGSFPTPPEERWRKVRSWEIDFTDSLTIQLSSARPGTIRYTLDGSEPTAASAAYTKSALTVIAFVSSEGGPLARTALQRRNN